MKKQLADKLAYELALKSLPNASLGLNEEGARGLAQFIHVLSAEFQSHLDDFEVSEKAD